MSELERSPITRRAAGAYRRNAEQEMGPFYVAYDGVRADILGGAVGLPLELEITVISSLTRQPITGAAVDIWQCDAEGVYSSESSENTVGQTFLRGAQFTDKHGHVTFKDRSTRVTMPGVRHTSTPGSTSGPRR